MSDDVPAAGTPDEGSDPLMVRPAHEVAEPEPPRPLRKRRVAVRRGAIALARGVLVVVAATMLTQWVLELAPGGISATILGNAASPENIAELDRELGLDRNFFVRYLDWAGGVLTGDFGRSPIDNRPVWDAITAALPTTLELVVLATSLALGAALAAGFASAAWPGSLLDRAIGAVTSAALSVPTFVLAPVLLYFLAVRSGMFPIVGWVPLTEDPVENLRTAALPAVCVAIPEFAVFQRLFRGDLVAAMDEDFIDAARARGVGEARLLVRHGFRPASLSLITVTGISVGRLLGGTVIVESLFVLPGLGLLLQSSIIKRDLVMLQGIVAFAAVSYVLINLFVDLLYRVVDPRIREAAGR